MKYVVALIACLFFFIFWAGFGAMVLGWQYGGGVIPQLVMLAIMGFIWRSITKNWSKYTGNVKANVDKGIASLQGPLINAPSCLHGDWESEHYFMSIGINTIKINEKSSGDIKYPRGSTIVAETSGFSISYTDPYVKSNVNISVNLIDEKTARLSILRDGIVVETREDLNRL